MLQAHTCTACPAHWGSTPSWPPRPPPARRWRVSLPAAAATSGGTRAPGTDAPPFYRHETGSMGEFNGWIYNSIKLDLSDETIRIQNFHFSQKL